MKFDSFSYRFANLVIKKEIIDEIENAIKEIEITLLDPDMVKASGTPKGAVKRRKRNPNKKVPYNSYFFLPVNQKDLNKQFEIELCDKIKCKLKKWRKQPLVIDDMNVWENLKKIPRYKNLPQTPPKIKADFMKERTHVEVQFGNMSRWYTDIFKFQISYSLGTIDAAILIVPKKRLANLIDENIATYERVLREISLAELTLTLPIMIYGVDVNKQDMNNIKKVYDKAFERLQKSMKERIEIIPLERRIKEEDEDITKDN